MSRTARRGPLYVVIAAALVPASAATGATVTVRPGDTLSGIALRNRVSTASIAAANGLRPQYVLRVGQRLRVPSLATPRAASVPRFYVVKTGDTLGGIANRNGLQLGELMRLNGITDSSFVTVGRRLRIGSAAAASPARQGVIVTNLPALPRPVRLATPSARTSSPRVGSDRPAATTSTTAAAFTTVYRIRPGESLTVIAERMGTTVGQLVSVNGLTDPNTVTAGSTIRTPGAGTPVTTGSSTVRYVVRPGDTLASIASANGSTVEELVRENNLTDANMLYAGRFILITLKSPGAATSSAGAARTHVVRPGETLSSLALEFGTGVGAILQLNGLADPNAIVVGQTLKIPPPDAAQTAPAAVRDAITRAANARGVDPALARAVAWQESGFSQSMVSPVGAIGVMQVLPATSDWAGRYIVRRTLNPYVLEDNIAAGVAYLDWLLDNAPDRRTAVAGYYQGLASVKSRGMLAETKQYVDNVMALVGRV